MYTSDSEGEASVFRGAKALVPVTQGPVPTQQPPHLPVDQLLEVDKPLLTFLLSRGLSSSQQSSCLTSWLQSVESLGIGKLICRCVLVKEIRANEKCSKMCWPYIPVRYVKIVRIIKHVYFVFNKIDQNDQNVLRMSRTAGEWGHRVKKTMGRVAIELKLVGNRFKLHGNVLRSRTRQKRSAVEIKTRWTYLGRITNVITMNYVHFFSPFCTDHSPFYNGTGRVKLGLQNPVFVTYCHRHLVKKM